jgi:hypothetical protein
LKRKSEREFLAEISRKIDRLIGVLSIQGKDVDAQIDILTKLGFKSREIGPLVGQHPDSVRRARSRKKKLSSSRPSKSAG